VKLPDGSRVWLNAASSLKYPVSFSSLKDRRVELHGEAYFEVAKDKLHPFLVETDGQEVTVLGTHFNIKAYRQDKNIVTTLAEGSVRVGYQASAWSDHGKIVYKDEVILSPGQQSLLKGETISVSKADMEESLAWKDGNFVFNDANIEKIMQDIARWYNIEVFYEGPSPTGAFSGNISRSKNISQILKALESTKLVHFKIEGRKVYVSK
jgi:ferric-dicitrate binding protein FerR (iron transport regulator)